MTVLVGIIVEFTRCGLDELIKSRVKYAEPKPRGEVYYYIDEVKDWIRLEEHQETAP